jgi:RND family efflux transporter MFP subunit
MFSSSHLSLLPIVALFITSCDHISRTPEAGIRPVNTVAVDAQAARLGTLLPPVEVVGTTTPEQSAIVRARSEGRLEQLHVGVGDKVTAGQEIARLEDDLLKQALAEANAALAVARAQAASVETSVKEAHLTLEQAKIEAERYAQLVARGFISQQESEQRATQAQTAAERLSSQTALLQAARQRVTAQEALVAQAKERLSYVSITAPMTGQVLEELTDPGNFLQVGGEIVRIGDLSQIEIVASVSELDLGRVTLGSTVSVRLDAFPETTWQGKVIRISPQADPVNRLVPISVLLSNPTGKLSAGLLARIDIAPPGDPRVIIPAAALSQGSRNMQTAEGSREPTLTDGRGARVGLASVFVVQDSPQGPVAAERQVTIGRRVDEQVEVLTGLRMGERVVVRSAQPLTPGTQVRLSAISQTETEELSHRVIESLSD